MDNWPRHMYLIKVDLVTTSLNLAISVLICSQNVLIQTVRDVIILKIVMPQTTVLSAILVIMLTMETVKVCRS